MSKPQTRAQVLGVKPGVLRAKTLRKVDRIEQLLREIAAPWEDVDAAIEMAIDAMLAGPLAEFRATVADSIEILSEPEGDY